MYQFRKIIIKYYTSFFVILNSRNPVFILYIWHVSIQTGRIQMLSSHMQTEATILNSKALDDQLFQIITNNGFFFNFFISFHFKYKKKRNIFSSLSNLFMKYSTQGCHRRPSANWFQPTLCLNLQCIHSSIAFMNAGLNSGFTAIQLYNLE